MSQGFGHLSVPEIDEDVDDFDVIEDDDFIEDASDSDDDQVAEETESHDNEPGEDWESRFKGLQASHQQTVEELRRELQQNQQLSQQAIQQMQARVFQSQIADLEPEEQAQAWANFQAAVRNQQAMSFLQQREQEVRQAYEFVNNAAREAAAHRIATSYQVPVDTLMKFDSPEEMQEAARLVKSKRSRKRKRPQQRQQRGGSQFEGGTAPGRQKKAPKPQTISEAKALFASLPVPGRQR